MIEFIDVVHKYGKKTVLNGINFKMNKGDVVCLLGPSGCGKTTMVNLIMGRIVPFDGQVTVSGEKAPYKTARGKIGYMPQEDALYDDITAIENLKFFGAMNGVSKSDINARIPGILDFGKLGNDGKKMVADFSGGMKRRLSLGVAMLHRPEVLILDEPTVGLDPEHRRRIWDRFDNMAAEGTTILVTTHVMDEALRCDRIAMVYDGHIIATGSPAEIMAKTNTDNLEDAFLALEDNYEGEVSSNV